MDIDWSAVWQWLGGAAGFVIVTAGATYKLWLPALKDFVFKWVDKRFERKLQETEHAFQEQLNETKQRHDVLTRRTCRPSPKLAQNRHDVLTFAE